MKRGYFIVSAYFGLVVVAGIVACMDIQGPTARLILLLDVVAGIGICFIPSRWFRQQSDPCKTEEHR